jgi:hypothetical protein
LVHTAPPRHLRRLLVASSLEHPILQMTLTSLLLLSAIMMVCMVDALPPTIVSDGDELTLTADKVNECIFPANKKLAPPAPPPPTHPPTRM